MHRSGKTENCRTNGLRRKRAWEAQKCTNNAKTRLPLRSRWAPRARTFLPISPWVPPCVATGAQRSQKPVPGTQDHQNVTSRAPKMSPGISKMVSKSRKRTQILMGGGPSSKLYIYIYIYCIQYIIYNI